MRYAIIRALLVITAKATLYYGLDLGEGTARLAVFDGYSIEYHSEQAYDRKSTAQEDATVYAKLIDRTKAPAHSSLLVAVSVLHDEEDAQDLMDAAELSGFTIQATTERWEAVLTALDYQVAGSALVIDTSKDSGEIVLVESYGSEPGHDQPIRITWAGYADCSGDSDLAEKIKSAIMTAYEDIESFLEEYKIQNLILSGRVDYPSVVHTAVETLFGYTIPLLHDPSTSENLVARGAAILASKELPPSVLERFTSDQEDSADLAHDEL